MSSQVMSSQREKAVVYTGSANCKKKMLELMEELHLPKGLVPLKDIIEVGYNKETGFVWVKRPKPIEHTNRQISRKTWYDKEVTAFVGDRKMKKVTGVKGKELLFWVTICDIFIDDPNYAKITFGTPTGITKSFPVSAFQEEEGKG